jgi:phenylalanyl-tRNA synthetase alpha chain
MIDIQNTVKNLHPLEVKVLLSYKAGNELMVGKIEGTWALKAVIGTGLCPGFRARGLVKEIRREEMVFLS